MYRFCLIIKYIASLISDGSEQRQRR